MHEKAGCDGIADCDDGTDEPFGAWSEWKTETGSSRCPEICDAGSIYRYRSVSCPVNPLGCDLPCAKDKAELKQQRVCPKIKCYQEAG